MLEGTRGRLLLAAVEMFATLGYDACSMRALGTAVGLGPGAIYNHYTSKGALLVAAVDYVLSDFMKAVLAGLPADRAPKTLSVILSRHLLYRARNISIAKASDRLLERDFMVRTMSRNDRNRLTTARAEYLRIIREIVDEVAGDDPDIDGQLRAATLIGLADEAATWYGGLRRSDDRIVVEQLQILAERLLGLEPYVLIGES